MTFGHSGDLGDIVASLSAVKKLGGGDYRIFHKPNGQRETMFGERFDAIKPLLEAQYYVQSVEWTDKPFGHDKDFSTFREKYQLHDNLATQQAAHVGASVDLSMPWLKVEPEYHENVIIARTSRYHNPIFPWRKIMDTVKPKIFVGIPSEHREFEAYFGTIPYQKTKDLLDLARIIAGAKMIISNQTCAFWIAAGLGKTLVQETYLKDMNSIVSRSNCRYTRTVEEVNQLIESL